MRCGRGTGRQTRAIALTAVTLLAGCEVPQMAGHTVYEDPANFVRLEPDPSVLPDVPRTAHSHPVRISAEDIGILLRRLWVHEHRNVVQTRLLGLAPPERAFEEDDNALLAPRLADALANAQPDERVTFYLSRPQTSVKREISSGGLYVRGQHLHVVLGNYRATYAIPAYGMVYDRRYPMMPTAPKAFDLVFEPPGATVRQPMGLWQQLWARDKDELVIDLCRVPAVFPPSGCTRTRPSPIVQDVGVQSS